MHLPKAYILGSALAAVLAAPAIGADLPSHKSAPTFVSTAPSWTGFYAGVNAGYTWSNSTAKVLAVGSGMQNVGTEVPMWQPYPIYAPGVAVLNSSGFIGGGQVGYNVQIGRFLIGAEGEFDWLSGSKKTSTFVTPGPIPLTANVAQIGRAWDWAGAATARVGYLVLPTLLVYAKGGAGFGHAAANVLDYGSTLTAMGGSPGVAGHVYGGWAFGGGVEWMVAPNWSVKVEYLRFDLGKHQASVNGLSYGTFPGVAPQTYLVQANLQQNVVKAAVNFHFNGLTGTPVADFGSAASAVRDRLN